ncbi:MAG: YfiT family bacillithiol transferase [Bacteroidia bacterium]
MEHLKYPIGKFEYGKSYTLTDTQQHLMEIEQFPDQLKKIVASLNTQQLDTPYRPNGWIGKQVIHHLADSHMNGYIRTKLTLTENKPTIKPYKEELWANLEDAKNAPIFISLALIEAIHYRWVYLLKSTTNLETELQKKYIHPEYQREFKLQEQLALYAWHGNHHYGHLQIIKNLP